VVVGGLVVIDDTWRDGASYQGKGATAVPLLLASDFSIEATTPTAIALRRRPRTQ